MKNETTKSGGAIEAILNAVQPMNMNTPVDFVAARAELAALRACREALAGMVELYEAIESKPGHAPAHYIARAALAAVRKEVQS